MPIVIAEFIITLIIFILILYKLFFTFRRSTNHRSFVERAIAEFKEKEHYDSKRVRVNISDIIQIIGLLAALIGLWVGFLSYYGALESAKVYALHRKETILNIEETFDKFIKDLKKRNDETNIPPDYLPFLETGIKDLDLQLKFGLESVKGSVSSFKAGDYYLPKYKSYRALLDLFEIIVDKLCQRYMDDSSMLDTKIIGFADGLKVSGNPRYWGIFGDNLKLKYYSFNDSEYKVRVFEKGRTKLQNEDFAALRAFGLKKHLSQLSAFKSEKCKFDIFTKTTQETGAQHRKVIFVVTIRDAFLKEFKELNFLGRYIYNKKFKNKED